MLTLTYLFSVPTPRYIPLLPLRPSKLALASYKPSPAATGRLVSHNAQLGFTSPISPSTELSPTSRAALNRHPCLLPRVPLGGCWPSQTLKSQPRTIQCASLRRQASDELLGGVLKNACLETQPTLSSLRMLFQSLVIRKCRDTRHRNINSYHHRLRLGTDIAWWPLTSDFPYSAEDVPAASPPN